MDKSNAQVVDVGPCWSRDHEIAEGREEIVTALPGEIPVSNQPQLVRPLEGVQSEQRPGVIARTVQPVRVRGEGMHAGVRTQRQGQGQGWRIVRLAP